MKKISKTTTEKVLTALVLVMFLVGSSLLGLTFMDGYSANVKKFKDVDENTVLGYSIMELTKSNVINGYPDNTFKPSVSVTRGQVAAFIDRAIVLENKVPKKHFTDVKGSAHEASIYRVQQAGIIDGYADGTFRPSEVLTRAQMAKIITKAFDLPKGKDSGFPDVPSNVWYKEYVDALAAKEITVGSDGKYLPAQAVTRGHFVRFLHRSLNWAKDEGKGYIKDGVVVSPPKVTEQPKPQPKPEPKPEPKPQPSTVKVTNQNKYSPYLNLKKDKNGHTIIDGKSYPIGMSQNRPKPGEKLGASTAHWYKNARDYIVVIKGQEISMDNFILKRDYLDDLAFNVEIAMVAMGYDVSRNWNKIIITKDNEKIIIDGDRNEINGKKISERKMTNYNSTIRLTSDIYEKHLGVSVHIERNPIIIYFGGRYLDTAGSSVSNQWIQYENMELKKNGYFAPKQIADVFVPTKTTKKTKESVWQDFERYADDYGVVGNDKSFINYYVRPIYHTNYNRLNNAIFGIYVYDLYYFPNYSVPQNASIHYVDSLSKFILGDDGGKVSKAYYDLMKSNVNLDKNEYKILKKINVNGTNVYFYNTRRLADGHKGLEIYFSQPNKEITGFYLE